MLNVGDKAPDFKLTTLTADGPAFTTLSENAGKSNTLILFFPMAFIGVCTQEFCDINNHFELIGNHALNIIEAAHAVSSAKSD